MIDENGSRLRKGGKVNSLRRSTRAALLHPAIDLVVGCNQHAHGHADRGRQQRNTLRVRDQRKCRATRFVVPQPQVRSVDRAAIATIDDPDAKDA